MTPEARALASADQEATERVRQARAGYFPRVDVTGDVQRGNQPVFVFSSLLSQRRFEASNFAIAALNEPSPVTNVRSRIAVEQPIFDGGLTRLAVEGAEIDREMTAATRADVHQDLALRAAHAFVNVLRFQAAARASQTAVTASESDLQRARARRDVGLVTDADVLAVEVTLADMRQRSITATADLDVARIELSEAIGMPLAEIGILVEPAPSAPSVPAAALAGDGLTSHPERRQAQLRRDLAANALSSARAQFLPRFAVDAGWETNGSQISDQRASWIVGAHVQVNLFRGFADRARLAEAEHAEARASAERERVERRIEVEIRTAEARLDAARARVAAGQAALTQAIESQRIVRDRYESGLATITDVLRAAEAALDAEARATAAKMDAIVSAVALERATGSL